MQTMTKAKCMRKRIAGKAIRTIAACGAIFAGGLYLTGSTIGALWVLGTVAVVGLMGLLYT